MEKKTKIVATIGPASNNPKKLKKMIQAGLNVARINASHGSHEQHQEIIENVRIAEKDCKKTVGIIYDLQGPKIRIGKLGNDGIRIEKGEIIVLHDGEAYLEKSGRKFFPIQYKDLTKEVSQGETILINDGLIELKVVGQNLRKTQIECEVITEGIIKSNKGINAPQTKLAAPALMEKDLTDLKFAKEANVDFVALSFVRSAEDIEQLREECKKLEFKPAIIAKIERPEAIENLKEITKAADAIMIARGDLGIEIPAAKVPLAQRRIIAIANRYAKPVIIATQVFNSMIENPRPTRAEISDAATAVFEHADAIMLSNETAVGEFPIETVDMLNEVIVTIESELANNEHLINTNKKTTLINAITLNAVELAKDLEARLLVAVTNSGYTARNIIKYRTFLPLVVYTNSLSTKRRLTLSWGINHVYADTDIVPSNPTPFLREDLKKRKLADPGDEIIVCNSGQNNKERLITTFKL